MDKIKQFQAGDKKVFESLFEDLFPRLCAFSYQYLEDSDAVEDLVQEAFISLWQKRSNFDHINSIKTYLYTSARNKCLNYLKHKAVVQKHQSGIIIELEQQSNFESRIVEEEVFGQLYNEIKNLPTAAQNIMLLVLKGKKNREIAETLSISENTVKTQKKIAYARLKQKVSPNLYVLLLSF